MINIANYKIELVKEKSARYDLPSKISASSDLYGALKSVINFDILCEEHLFLLTLNTNNKITGVFTVSQGSLNASIIHPREIFKRALVANAAKIVLAHNHPSGDSTPSIEDIDVTYRIKECGKLMGIELIDHIVVGDNCYASLKTLGKI